MKTAPCQKCRKFIELNGINAPLKTAQKKQLQQHLFACPDCRAFLAEENRLSEFLDDCFLSYAHGNSTLASAIHAALPEAPSASRKPYISRFLTLEAAAAVVLFCLGIVAGWLITGHNGEQTIQDNSELTVPPGENSASAPASQFISSGNRNHTVLPENKLRTSERRKLKIILGGDADIRIEVNHEESLMEDLDPDLEKRLEKFLY